MRIYSEFQRKSWHHIPEWLENFLTIFTRKPASLAVLCIRAFSYFLSHHIFDLWSHAIEMPFLPAVTTFDGWRIYNFRVEEMRRRLDFERIFFFGVLQRLGGPLGLDNDASNVVCIMRWTVKYASFRRSARTYEMSAGGSKKMLLPVRIMAVSV